MSDSCCSTEDDTHSFDLTALLITDLKENQLLNQVLKAMDNLPALEVIFVSPQILLRLERTQADSFTQFIFDSYGCQIVCLQMPAFKMRSVEPLPVLRHLSIHSMQPKIIRVMDKTCPMLRCLEVVNEMRGDSLMFLPRGIKRLKMRLRGDSGSLFMSSGASQSVTDLHLIIMSDINFGGRPRSLPRLKKLKMDANLNNDVISNLALFLKNQNLTHLTISFLSRSSFSSGQSSVMTVSDTEDNEEDLLKKLVNSLQGLEFLKMITPSLDVNSAKTILDSNPKLSHLELSGLDWDDSVLEALGQLQNLKHLSISVNGDSFTKQGMTSFVRSIKKSSIEYLLIRDITDASIVTQDIKDSIQAMANEGNLRKVLLCDHINWGFMII